MAEPARRLDPEENRGVRIVRPKPPRPESEITDINEYRARRQREFPGVPNSSQSQEPERAPEQRSRKVSNAEWGLLIGAAFIIDMVELLLLFLAIGVVANEFIDVVVGMAFPLYFKLRGIKVTQKKALTWIGAYVAEALTDGILVIGWTIDIVLTMLMHKAEERLEKLHI